jgi:hypothetical protein
MIVLSLWRPNWVGESTTDLIEENPRRPLLTRVHCIDFLSIHNFQRFVSGKGDRAQRDQQQIPSSVHQFLVSVRLPELNA